VISATLVFVTGTCNSSNW